MQNWGLDASGLADPGKTSGLPGKGLYFDRQESVGPDLGQFGNRTKL